MCSIASGSISSQKPAFFSQTLQSRSMIHSVHHHGVSRAEFSLTEPIPLQAVYIDHSRNPRLLYGSPWSRTHGRWLKEFFRPGRWVLLGRLPPSGVVLSPPLIDPPGWETHGRWERLISSQQVIDLSTAYNINNQTQGTKLIGPYPCLQWPL